MIRAKVVLAVGAAILLWSVQDILIWQRIFEARHLWQYDGMYQFWHYAFLIGILVVGSAWLTRWQAIWFAAATWTLANSGLADVLYYWLDRKPIPETLPWLDTLHPLIFFHPATTSTVLMSSLFWVGFWLLTVPTIDGLAHLNDLVKELIHRDREGVIVGRGL